MAFGFLLAVAPVPGFADVVRLKAGGSIEGIVKEEGDKVLVETLAGNITVAADEVASIDREHTSRLEEYYRKEEAAASSRRPKDFLALAAWAKENGAARFVRPNVERAAALAKNVSDPKALAALAESAAEESLRAELGPLWERLIAVDPDNETARRALGHRRHEGRWLTEEEFEFAQGHVSFRGGWVSREERDILLKELRLKLDARERIVRNRETAVEGREASVAAAKRELEARRRALEELERKLAGERAKIEQERRKLERDRSNLEAQRRRLDRKRGK
jgi:hypothetical protein